MEWLRKLFRSGNKISANSHSYAAGRDIYIYLNDLSNVPSTGIPEEVSIRIARFIEYHVGKNDKPVPFGGRRKQIDALNDWLDGDDSCRNNLILTAPMGRGKTSLLLHWIGQVDNRWNIVFVPINLAAGLTHETDFYHALAGRLATILGESLNSAWLSDPGTYYRNQAVRLISRVQESGIRCLIVVDGLDEADWRLDPAALPPSKTPSLKVLVGARTLIGDQRSAGWRQHLQWDHPADSCREMDLPTLDETGVREVLEAWNSAIGARHILSTIDTELFRLTAGDALLIRLYLNELERDLAGEPTEALRNLTSFEPGYRAFFRQCWQAERPRADDGDRSSQRTPVEAILAVLACAHGPMKLAALDRVARATSIFKLQHPITYSDFHSIRRWIIGDGIETGISFSHPKLAEYFREEHFGAGDAICQVEHAIIGWGKEVINGLKKNTIKPNESAQFDYILSHYLSHLISTRSPIDNLTAIIDKYWMLARRHQLGSYWGFISDISVILATIRFSLETQPSTLVFLLAAEIKCVLCLSTIYGMGSEVAPALLASALQEGTITIEEAKHLAEIRPSGQRISALTAIFSWLPSLDRESVIQSILQLPDPNERAGPNIKIPPY